MARFRKAFPDENLRGFSIFSRACFRVSIAPFFLAGSPMPFCFISVVTPIGTVIGLNWNFSIWLSKFLFFLKARVACAVTIQALPPQDHIDLFDVFG